jgi:acetyl/propionyl-CoA carboxylase alpha subunit
MPRVRRGSREELPAVSGNGDRLVLPEGEGIRVEAGVAEGVTVPVHYDPLLMKLIARGADRAEAIARLSLALDACVVEGVRTTLPFLRG